MDVHEEQNFFSLINFNFSDIHFHAKSPILTFAYIMYINFILKFYYLKSSFAFNTTGCVQRF